MKKNNPLVQKGSPLPLGAKIVEAEGVNFALFSRHATAVTLCLFKKNTETPLLEVYLDPAIHKTGDIWHAFVGKVPPDTLYAYKLKGPEDLKLGLDYQENRLLLDPYAKSVATTNVWGLKAEERNLHYKPLGALIHSVFDWGSDVYPRIPLKNLIVYEMHVRGFTESPSSKVKHPGTFLGIIEKIPHLIDLGVNAIELLPIQEFNEQEWDKTNTRTNERLYNYWGYSTVNFFSPMNRYASDSNPGTAITDFKTLVKALHSSGIEVILDVVFNHTNEGNRQGLTLSFRGIDNPIYYLLSEGEYKDFTGCGNTVNCNHPVVREFIIDCLRYWVLEMHVDGFRFDLASIFSRDKNGIPIANSPLIDAIAQDPVLIQTKIIAEPWDVGGLYQVGGFYPESSRWQEWNGQYRDSVRQYIKGQGKKETFATRLCGSEDIYKGRSPICSLNFITAHDGFTLYDLVSYNQKHNEDNGEENRDGLNENDSWNCGVEGPSTNAKINALRLKQMCNLHLSLMISLGVPMILMGDEYGHSRMGNNNTWCQDNTLNWFLWDSLLSNEGYYRFYKMMIHFRKNNPLLLRDNFYTVDDIEWHGMTPHSPEWGNDHRFLGMRIKDKEKGNDLYIGFNTANTILNVKLPECNSPNKWHVIVNTGMPPPKDIVEESESLAITNLTFKMVSHSAMILKAL